MKKQIKKIGAFLMSVGLAVSGSFTQTIQTFAEESELQPGEMRLKKTAEPVEGSVNTWKVTVTAESKDVLRPKDYVLVIDRSGSMLYDANNTKNKEEKEDSRIVYAREAAKDLAAAIYEADDKNRVGIISFASAPTSDIIENGDYKAGTTHTKTDIVLSGKDQLDAVEAAIDGIKCTGGTYTQLALHEAQAMMEAAHKEPDGAERDRVIILLTDGAPTLAVGIDDWSEVPLEKSATGPYYQYSKQKTFSDGVDKGKPIYLDENGKETPNATSPSGQPNKPYMIVNHTGPIKNQWTNTSNIPESAFDYANANTQTFGYGVADNYAKTAYTKNGAPVYANILNMTIAESNYIREKGDVQDLFVIGYDVNASDAASVKQLAGDDSHYINAKGENGVKAAMDTILERTAATNFNATMMDEIPNGFARPEQIIASTGTAVYDETKRTITWDFLTPNVAKEGTEPTERSATLTYILKVADDATFADDKPFNTNGTTKVNYNNPNRTDNPQTSEVKSPQVKVSKYTIKKTVTNDGNDDNEFKIRVTSPGGSVREFNLKHDGTALATAFTETGTYTVNEIVDANGYAVKYKIDEVETNTFTMETKPTNESKIVNIVIENTRKTYGTSHRFVSGTEGRELPDEVLALTPIETDGHYNGTAIDATQPTQTSIQVGEDLWEFIGYDANQKTINGADVTFVGTWVVKHNPPFEVTYVYQSGTPGKVLPEEVVNMTPATVTDKHPDETVDAEQPQTNEYQVEGGKWVFNGYNKTSVTITDHDDQFVGTWTFVEEKHNVTYEYVSGTPNKELPDEIRNMTPPSETDISYGTEVSVVPPSKTEVPVDGGKWVFKNYDKDSVTIRNQDEKFTGTWEFIEDTYNVTYEYVSATAGKELPDEVKNLTPAIATGIRDGETVGVIEPTTTEVVVSDGTWTFIGYDSSTVTINKADGHFEGSWVFKAAPKTYGVTYEYVSATPNKELPQEVLDLTPSDDQRYSDGDSSDAKQPSVTEVKVSGGKWVFKSYDKNSLTIEGADGKFTGTWEFVEDPKEDTSYKVTYEYISGTPNKELPQEVKDLTPQSYVNLKDGDKVSAVNPTKLEVKVTGGKWVFKSYDRNDLTIAGADGRFVGVWVFEADPVNAVKPPKKSTTPVPNTADTGK